MYLSIIILPLLGSLLFIPVSYLTLNSTSANSTLFSPQTNKLNKHNYINNSFINNIINSNYNNYRDTY